MKRLFYLFIFTFVRSPRLKSKSGILTEMEGPKTPPQPGSGTIHPCWFVRVYDESPFMVGIAPCRKRNYRCNTMKLHI